ncbi:MAG TPA: hypothetical protein VK338_00100 [Candidatus Nitrosocosmicus sp.]|nr:hypothetical protein [Candidatus Nitrosocosmicus sp.]
MNIKFGFTIIELLIIIGVITLFSGMSLAFYHNFNEQKKLEADVRNLKSIIELTHKKAMSGDKSPCSDQTQPLQAYSIQYTSIYYTINNGCANPTEIARYSLADNNTLLSSGTIQFKISEPGIIGDKQTFIIKNNAINKCNQISLDISGIINEENRVCP